MSQAKSALNPGPAVEAQPLAEQVNRNAAVSALPGKIPPLTPSSLTIVEPATPGVGPVAPLSAANPLPRPRRDNNSSNFQARVPVVTGEATFRGWMPVDGIISGQLGANGSALAIKQRPHGFDSEPELTGEIRFKDMLRINGHIAGKVTSLKGTLIVDGSALVDGDIDVAAVVISGTVNGDVIAQERVELGAAAVINGNISTRILTMKPGAIFQGDCRMLQDEISAK
jgi:cytoskeletal protein CcmA (bactofilin family)